MKNSTKNFLTELIKKYPSLAICEKDIKKAYELNYVKILPSYQESLFTYEYIPQILTETEAVGIVAKGFFSNYTYDLSDSVLNINIPFSQNGVILLVNAETPQIIQNIIFSEFGKRIHQGRDPAGIPELRQLRFRL